jgi:SAM-dependent methyltransferase
MNVKTGVPSPDAESMVVDAFGYLPDQSSRLQGLGGSQPASDPSYAFHSTYVATSGGALSFKLQMTGCSASEGTLSLRINALPVKAGSDAVAVKTVEVPLAELASAGEVTLQIAAAGNRLYALLGNIYDHTDASGGYISIVVERTVDAGSRSSGLTPPRKPIFSFWTRPALRSLIAQGPPTLTEPVCQMCTAAQFEEPVYNEWLTRLNAAFHRHRKQWEFVYILQALSHYGALRPGSRGVGFGVGIEPLPAVMASLGCKVVGTDLDAEDSRSADWSATQQHGSHVSNLRRPDICPDDLFYERVSFQPADMTRIPSSLRDFDFTWSSCAYEHLGSIEAGLQFVENSIDCLRPGGVAVHTTEYNVGSNKKTLDNGGTVLFRRKDIEKLVRRLLAKGHQVAKLNFDAGSGELDAHIDFPPYSSDVHLKLALASFVTTSFGIIVRKSPE